MIFFESISPPHFPLSFCVAVHLDYVVSTVDYASESRKVSVCARARGK